MSEIPEGLIYTKEHEWIKVEGNDITVGADRAFPKLEVRIVRHVDAYISADSSAN